MGWVQEALRGWGEQKGARGSGSRGWGDQRGQTLEFTVSSWSRKLSHLFLSGSELAALLTGFRVALRRNSEDYRKA